MKRFMVLLMLLISVKVGFAELIGKSYISKGRSISQTWENWPDSISLDSCEVFSFYTIFPGDIRETFFLAFENWQGAEAVVVTVDGLATRVTEVWQPGTSITYETPDETMFLGQAAHYTAQYRWRGGSTKASNIRVEAKGRVTVFIPKAGTRWLGH